MHKIFIIIAVVMGSLFLLDVGTFFNASNALEQPEVIDIQPNSSFKQVLRQLREKGVFTDSRQVSYFMVYARLKGQTGHIKTGEFLVDPSLTPSQLLHLLVNGKPIQHQITLISGWTFADMREAIAANDKLKHSLIGQTDQEIMAQLGHPDEHPEGRFLPETYNFTRGASDLSIYQRAYNNMQKTLNTLWAERSEKAVVNTPYEALILASLIEKETGKASERERISGVFTRRLQKGMRLQTDPTIIYGSGLTDRRIRSKDLRADTPYNTYLHAGLTPTPIAMPSKAAIKAALNPADGNALYFVSKGDGSHQFSATLKEHNRAVRKYILGQ